MYECVYGIGVEVCNYKYTTNTDGGKNNNNNNIDIFTLLYYII